MKLKIVQLFIFITVLIAMTSYASNRFQHLSPKNGLSQATVICMLQDRKGFLWFGTLGGLNRYDGHNVKTFLYDPDNTNSISSNNITSLYEDSKGNIWVGTYDKGINKFNPQDDTFSPITQDLNIQNKLSNYQIRTIVEDDEGQLWIGTPHNGIVVYTPSTDSFAFYRHDTKNSTSLSSNLVSAMFIDSKKKIWVGTDNGLNYYNSQNNSFTRFNHQKNNENSLSSDDITSLIASRNGEMWIGTSNAGLTKFQPTTGVFTRLQQDNNQANGSESSHILTLMEDEQGHLWVGTNRGVYKLVLETSDFVHFSHSSEDFESLGGDTIFSIMQSKDGVIWLGTEYAGASIYDPKQEQFHHVKRTQDPNSLRSNNIRAIFKDENGPLWVGTDGEGLHRLNPRLNSFTNFQHNAQDPSTISNNQVYAIAKDDSGIIWLGTFGGGVNKYDPKTGVFEHFKADAKDPRSLSGDAILSLFIDSKNNLWVGSYQGLDLYNRDTNDFKSFKHEEGNENSLSNSAILAIFEDSAGTLWLGTYGGGLNKFDAVTESFISYQVQANNSNSLSNNNVMSIVEDQNHHLWMATLDGVNKMDKENGVFKRFGIKQGLASSSVYGMLYDNLGKIWLSSNAGLATLDPLTEQVTSYTIEDGLQDNEFSSGAQFKASDGELFFGGVQGYNHFYPKNITTEQYELSVVLTQMRLSNVPITPLTTTDSGFQLKKNLPYTEAITLTHRDRLFSFEFATLHYSNTDKISYAYKLENWDKAWIYTDDNYRQATFTNIPAGNYVLKVKAKFSGGEWSPRTASIRIIVKPAPWLTWWAYTGYFIVFFIVLSLFILQRYQKFKAIEEREHRLSLALWASGNELWDWDITKQHMFRSNTQNTVYSKEGIEDFNYQALRKRVHPDDIEAVIEVFEHHRNNESHFIDTSYRLKNKQGEWLWIRNRAKAVDRDDEGNALRIVGTVQDIQTLKQAQDDLQQLNEELEKRVKERTLQLTEAFNELKHTQQQLVESEKLASLGGLVAGMAHELNTPLGIALTSSTLIEEEIINICQLKNSQKLTLTALNRFEKMTAEGLNLLSRNLKRTNLLIQNFKELALEYSAENIQEFNLNQQLSTVKRQILDEYKATKVTINILCDSNITMTSYPHAIFDVIQNLVSNSITHGFESMLAGEVTIQVTKLQDSIELIYTDNGVGLTAEVLEKIYEPFYTTKRSSDCTGLGMLIVHNLVVRQLQGTVLCSSPLNEGFHVVINIPEQLNDVL